MANTASACISGSNREWAKSRLNSSASSLCKTQRGLRGRILRLLLEACSKSFFCELPKSQNIAYEVLSSLWLENWAHRKTLAGYSWWFRWAYLLHFWSWSPKSSLGWRRNLQRLLFSGGVREQGRCSNIELSFCHSSSAETARIYFWDWFSQFDAFCALLAKSTPPTHSPNYLRNCWSFSISICPTLPWSCMICCC